MFNELKGCSMGHRGVHWDKEGLNGPKVYSMNLRGVQWAIVVSIGTKKD